MRTAAIPFSPGRSVRRRLFREAAKQKPFRPFPGHPEYETLSLLGEYRRDMGRFLRGESEVCPTIPKGYFDEKAEDILTTFRRGAITNRSPEFFAGFPTDLLAKDVRNVWQSSARRLYRNWLLYLEAQRVKRSNPAYGL